MNKKVVLVAIGTLLGAVGAYVAYNKREEILAKLQQLQESLKEAEITEKAKATIHEIAEKLSNLIKRSDTLTAEEKEKELKEIEEKIGKLEEAVKAE
ncbi:hypothetical protein JCM14244_16360 [Venenivibrio stagnispumantis]|uniref:YtxH domain-containing protein n=1 Tax=Venenivibrio stagnispumantis TaxID=407998 RepID=A0AA45WPK4_9AQUI|nr:YtxH domain-containing protein [Venenivibrio stagnispumantis]MCW4574010.1 YtxH domain-containing protein [Venenivibrio stagnispumantis]SMP21183.1 hypothetical protein SAMN06264868_12228 [Venenivibrio stagnispumantis]